MKKLSFLLTTLLSLTLLIGCSKEPNVGNYYINANGELIVVYDNGSEKILGDWGDEIINSLNEISISSDGYYIINGVKTSIKVNYDSVTISDDGYYIINGVKTGIVATQMFDVSFYTGYSANVPSQKIKDGYKVEKPDLERKGYSLKGWFCNGEEWRFNSDVVKNDMVLAAQWIANTYSVSFTNSRGENPSSIEVTYDSPFQLPEVNPVVGYTFNGWYYQNSKVEQGIWNIDEDVVLDAKWTRDTYTISFDSDGGSSVSSIIVDSYSTIEALPIPTKIDFEFLGWFLDENLIELPYEFTEGNIQLKAHWKGINEKFDFTDDDSGTGIKITNYKLDEENVVIPNTIAGKTVSTIGMSAFKNKNNIKVIDFGNAVNFEYKALDNCPSIEELQLLGESSATLTYIFGNNANIPTSLKTITFKTNSTTFGDGIFTGVSGHLFRVNAYASITNAPADAFYQCDVIESIYFSDTITKFGNRVVCACSNLTYVKLPSRLKSVGMNNFMNCNIKYIIYPISLTSSDYGGLCSSGVILVESQTRPTGWSSSAFSIYEEQLPIFYGFESLHETDDFLYALCKVGSTKQCIIIQRYSANTAYPEFIDEYPVTFTNDNYTQAK